MAVKPMATITNFQTHPWDCEAEAVPLVCPLCGLDATGIPHPDVPPCKTRVVNTGVSRYDVYIGRGRDSVWGNPFVEGKDGTRDEVITKYEAWLLEQPHLIARLPELRGRVLGCWCAPKPCHGDVLARLADAGLSPPPATTDPVNDLATLVAPNPDVPMEDDFDKRVIILDVESTGTDRSKDQIIELAVQFGFDDADGTPAPQRLWTFKPSVPIHPGASEVHGYTDATVAKFPPFITAAQAIAEMLDEAEVIIGYNVVFDLDMLAAELARVGMKMPSLQGKFIADALRLWHRFEPRTLTFAHKRFVGGDFENAHSAGADIAATGRVMLGMLEAFDLLGRGWDEIAHLCEPERGSWLGNSDHFKWTFDDEGNPVVQITFGKHKGKLVHEMAGGDLGYMKWLLGQDFAPHVKEIAQAALKLKGRPFLTWAMGKYPPPAAPSGASADGEVAP